MLTCGCFLTHTCSAEHVHANDVTQRISFYIAATNPQNHSEYIPKSDLEAAIQWVNVHRDCELELRMNHCNSFATERVSLVLAWQTRWCRLRRSICLWNACGCLFPKRPPCSESSISCNIKFKSTAKNTNEASCWAINCILFVIFSIIQ